MKILPSTVATFLAVIAGLVSAVPVGASAADPAAAARATVDEALTELLAVLASGQPAEQRQVAIEKIVVERFDMPAVAKLSLGKGRSLFSKDQAARYVCEFEPYLSNYIGSRFDRYQQEKVEIESAKPSKNDIIVRTRILGGEFDRALVDFRMRATNDQWHAIDVTFEGISVVRNLRDQFSEILGSGGPDALIRSLNEKNGSRSDCGS